jgi:hypothetical protein
MSFSAPVRHTEEGQHETWQRVPQTSSFIWMNPKETALRAGQCFEWDQANLVHCRDAGYIRLSPQGNQFCGMPASDRPSTVL